MVNLFLLITLICIFINMEISEMDYKQMSNVYAPLFDLFWHNYNMCLTIEEIDEIILQSQKVIENVEKIISNEKIKSINQIN